MPRYQIYYARKLTYHWRGRSGAPQLTVSSLVTIHVHVCDVEADSLDDAWRQMQAKNWSPKGEARPLLKRLGLTHTSMSVGDVIRDEEGTYWECMDLGWRTLEDDTQGDEGHGQA
jgi:hypothetical protein